MDNQTFNGQDELAYPLQKMQKRSSVGKLVLFGALALLVVLAGGGLIYYTAVAHPAQLLAQATLTANAQATSTTIAFNNSLVTQQAQGNAYATATVLTQQSIYSSATQGNPVLNDTLQSNSSSNWSIFTSQDGTECSFAGGALHSITRQNHTASACIALASDFTNFAFQITMTILKGDTGGILFRANPLASTGYYFRIFRDGNDSLSLAQGNENDTQIVIGSSRAIKSQLGASNVLTVIARGSSIYLYINKQFAATINDGTYLSGQIGVDSQFIINPSDVAFSDAQVWQL